MSDSWYLAVFSSRNSYNLSSKQLHIILSQLYEVRHVKKPKLSLQLEL